MTKIKNWLRYWKNSLADVERAEIDIQRHKHSDHVIIVLNYMSNLSISLKCI